MPIFKITHTVTTFFEAPSARIAEEFMSQVELGFILQEMDSGSMIGSINVEKIHPVSKKDLRDELLEIGNDGEFFGAGEESETP